MPHPIVSSRAPSGGAAPPRNLLLKALAPEDLAHLAPHLEPVELVLREVVMTQGDPIGHALFPEIGMVSLLADAASGRHEVGMVGPEGMIGLSLLFGVGRTIHTALVQGSGRALRAPAAAIAAALDERPALRRVMLRYAHAQVVQLAGTAYANAALRLNERLARWLLMMHDRLGRDDMPVTHDMLAAMLGARRPGVTLAVQALEGAGLIRATRGLVVVRDRAGLEAMAGEGYGRAEAEYEAVMAHPTAGRPAEPRAGT